MNNNPLGLARTNNQSISRQEIEWHHKWEPPHPQAPAMEEFIETEGRWATAEDEAEMRMTARRGVRERREAEEAGAGGDASGTVVLDDDDEDEGDATTVGLGEGVKVRSMTRGRRSRGNALFLCPPKQLYYTCTNIKNLLFFFPNGRLCSRRPPETTKTTRRLTTRRMVTTCSVLWD